MYHAEHYCGHWLLLSHRPGEDDYSLWCCELAGSSSRCTKPCKALPGGMLLLSAHCCTTGSRMEVTSWLTAQARVAAAPRFDAGRGSR